MKPTDVREATHVKCPDGRIERIVEKVGIDHEGRLAPPSRGGFAVRTETGKTIGMWQARAYFKEETNL